MGNRITRDDRGAVHSFKDKPIKSEDLLYIQKRWYSHGVIHREQGPAIVGLSGSKVAFESYVRNGRVSRSILYPPCVPCEIQVWCDEGRVTRARNEKGEEANIEENEVRFPAHVLRFDASGFLGGGLQPANEYSFGPVNSRERVVEYWTEFRFDSFLIKELSLDDDKCAICLVNQKSIAFAPCGHASWCESCAREMKVCPLCRESVSSRLRIYV